MKTSSLQSLDICIQKVTKLWGIDPETYHNIAMMASQYAEKSQLILESIKEASYVPWQESLETNISWLRLPNPVWLAAGFTKAPYGLKFWEAFGFGSITIWWVTQDAQTGNNRQRIFRFGNDIVNGMGLPGKWLPHTKKMLQERLQDSNMPNIPIWANLCNSASTKPEDKIAEFKTEMSELYPFVEYFEINISCPNQAWVCGLTQQLENILQELTKFNDKLAVSNNITKRKLFVKISPLSQNPQDPKDGSVAWLKSIAEICNQYQNDWVHAVIATNTAQEHKYTNKTQISTPSWDTITWGASGEQIQLISQKTVSTLRDTLDKNIPIIWVGGIWYDTVETEWKSAIDMIHSWADALQIYSSFVNKSVLTPMKIKQALMKKED